MKWLGFQVRYDFINGIVYQWKKFMLLAIAYAVIIADFLVRCKVRNLLGDFTCTDVVLWVFKGMSLIGAGSQDFNIPTSYILPNVLIAFVIGNYPFKDINGYGGMVLMRAGKKSVWWISKCIWAVITAVVSYGILLIEVLVAALAGGKLTWQVNKNVCRIVSGYNKVLIENNPYFTRLAVCMLIAGLLTTIAICFVQICVSQFMGPVIGYIAVIVILIVSVFFNTFALPGNAFMAFRNVMYVPRGGDIKLSLIVDAVLIVISAAAGYLSFKRMDIIKKNDWRML